MLHVHDMTVRVFVLLLPRLVDTERPCWHLERGLVLRHACVLLSLHVQLLPCLGRSQDWCGGRDTPPVQVQPEEPAATLAQQEGQRGGARSSTGQAHQQQQPAAAGKLPTVFQ